MSLYSDYSWPSYGGLTPFNHQKETVKFLLQNKRAFVLNDLGTGKTLSVLWAADILFKAQKIRSVLIFCPLSTMSTVWLREIRMHFPHRRVVIAHGSRQQRKDAIRFGAEFIITNHDSIRTSFDDLKYLNADIIVIDELTAFKSHSAERTKGMLKLAHGAKACWGLTGNATPNSPMEAYSQARIVNPFNPGLPPYFTRYREMTMNKINDYVYLPKPEAPNIVASILQPAIRYKRSDCIDLPPTTYETLEVPMSGEQVAAYNEMKQSLYLEHQQGNISAANAAVALNKLLQISAGVVKNIAGEIVKFNNQNKLDQLFEIYQETEQKKLIVFAAFRASVEQITAFFRSKGVSADMIYGGISATDRSRSITQFQEGGLNVLVMQPQSSAHGITLTAANTIVWFTLIPSNEYYEQANARIVRPGQIRNTLIIKFISSKAEEHIAKILERKEKMSDQIIKLFEARNL